MEDEHRFEDDDLPEDEGLPEDLDAGLFQMPEADGRPDGGPDPDNLDEKEVTVVGVYEHQDSSTQQSSAFVLLRDSDDRSVLIWIGRAEAFSISVALEGASADRPMTHDLMKNIITRFGGTVEKIIIDDLWHDTYYAKVHVSVGDRTVVIDSRPSDAIALGLRAKARVYMAEAVIAQAAVHEE